MDPKQTGAPPPYNTGQYPPGAYPPPQAGYPQGYAQPPHAGYNQGYAPQPQPGYAPPPQGYAPGYAPQPAGMHSSSSTNVVVVGQQQPVQTVVVQRQGVNHLLHFIITLFFWPWVIVWIILCITDDS